MTTALTPAMAARERLPRNVLAVQPLELGASTAALCLLEPPQLARHVDAVCDRIDAVEPQLRSLLPEPERRQRLQREMAELAQRYPDPATRPPLFGALLAVKDILRAEGHDTRCGSALPAEAFASHLKVENGAVARAKAAGALVLGKTVTTEFACSEPGATTNPWDPNHTPGGSSQGSAAAVSAGLAQLSLGSQTGGSTNRPGAFCGIVALKATKDRVPADGCVMISNTLDHVGLYANTVASMELVASVILNGWDTDPGTTPTDGSDVIIGIPTGPYLDKTDGAALLDFDAAIERLESTGVQVKRVPLIEHVDDLSQAHLDVMRYEAAVENPGVHGNGPDGAGWWDSYQGLYRARTADLVTKGLNTTRDNYQAGLAAREALQTHLREVTAAHGIDYWITPGATGPAPMGLTSTGDHILQMPWTFAGWPSLSVRATIAPRLCLHLLNGRSEM
jgi:Asp-tRNA(Asn)/Glu-tRNA(Gln) amidotransferase A subunit family amidase